MSDNLSRLLPQTGPARLIVELLESTDGQTECRALIPPDSPFRVRGSDGDLIPAYLSLEMGAQAAAALVGVPAHPDKSGVIVAAKNAVFPKPALAADASFLIAIHAMHEAPPLRVYAFEVRIEDETVATGEVSIYADG